MPLDVLEEDDLRLDFADDPRDMGPEVTGIVGTTTTPGDAEWLARVSGSDEIHLSAPSAAVEGREIVPDRRAIQGLVAHPRHESGRRAGVPLDETHGSVVGLGECNAEVEASVPGAEGQARPGVGVMT